MKLTVIGATGGTGRQLVAQAVTAGHDVTAVARNPTAVDAPVRTIAADLAAPDTAPLASALEGSDAVLSALGPSGRPETCVMSRGTDAIVQAMQAIGLRRLVVLSASSLSTVPSPANPRPPRRDPGEGPLMRYLVTPLVKTALRKSYADMALMEDAVRASALDWTLIRPNALTNRASSGAYRTAFGRNVRGGTFVSRADVAHLMLRTLDDPGSIHQAVAVAN